MDPFYYYVRTPIYFGQNSVKDNANVISGYGKRAYIITDVFYDGYENIALKDVKEVLEDSGIPYEVNDEVEENPSVESCQKIFKAAQKFSPDFMIGIGGGSTLDAIKAVNLQFEYPDKEIYELFFENKANFFEITGSAGAMPIVGIPTTAGTGSEVTSGSVMTRNDLHTKVNIKHKLYFTAAFLDSRYIINSPDFLVCTGVLDALAHAMETYINKNSSWLSQKIASLEFELFSEYKDRLLNGGLIDDDYDKMILGASIACMAMDHGGTTLPHGLGYPLSHYHGVNHGFSSSITLGEYMNSFKDKTYANKIMEMCGFKNTQEMSDYIAEIVGRHLKLEVTTDEIDKWTDFFWENEQDNRLKRNPEPVTKEQIKNIYLGSLKQYITD